MEENTMASNNNKKEILVLSALGLLLVEEEICHRQKLRRNGTKSWISQRQAQGAFPCQITEKINISEKETKKKKSLQSQLTRYRKLSPSGSSGTDKTPRQQRILRMLEFLKPHTKSNLTHTEPPAPTDTSSGATVDSLDDNQDETAFEPLIAESTFLDPGFESTSSSSSAGSPQRPPAKRSRKSHDDSMAGTKMRTIEAALHRMSAEGRPDFITVACQSIEHKFRMVPPHLLPRLENRVQNLIFNFFEEHNLDTRTHDS